MNNQPQPTSATHSPEVRTAVTHNTVTRRVAIASVTALTLLWLAQPPARLWPLALVALVPWMRIVTEVQPLGRRGYLWLWMISTLYWLISLQGLRHAHPAMCVPWAALGAYLAAYHVLFVVVARRLVMVGVPLLVSVPVAWVAQECLRNYLLTGISVLMLGHTMADVPSMIQIADLAGSYAVSFVLAVINVALWTLLQLARRATTIRGSLGALASSLLVVAGTLAYGQYRLAQPLGGRTASFALIQRAEAVDYGQSIEREIEIFQNYAQQSVDSIGSVSQRVDVVVWPESMFTGGAPWMEIEHDANVPAEASMSPQEFRLAVQERQQYVLQRARYVQHAISQAGEQSGLPHLLAGCGVVRYGQTASVYCGVLSIGPDGTLDDWYGKTHLVMFGEYIPILPYIPGVRSLIPPMIGLQTGPEAKRMQVGETSVSPNICIETAVERVTVNQLAWLRRRESLPEVIVTVTNDGWFDDSSVMEHHLRCAQLVAVGCRRPILSAGNNGPTAWIDSRGQVVDRLGLGSNGAVIANPQRDRRTSLYVRIGDWPARLCVLLCLAILGLNSRRWRLHS